MDSSPKNENSVIIYSSSSSSKPVWMCLFCWTQRRIFWRMWEQSSSGALLTFIVFLSWKSMPGFKLSSESLSLCSADQINSYRLGTTWEWVNDVRIFIFGVNYSFLQTDKRTALPMTCFTDVWIYFMALCHPPATIRSTFAMTSNI